MAEHSTAHPEFENVDRDPKTGLPHAGRALTNALFPELRQARVDGECVTCHVRPTPEMMAEWTEAGRREFAISQQCEPCFDRMWGDDE